MNSIENNFRIAVEKINTNNAVKLFEEFQFEIENLQIFLVLSESHLNQLHKILLCSTIHFVGDLNGFWYLISNVRINTIP